MNLVNGMESDAVSVHDRGLMYGDGVFRTLTLRAGAPRLWQRQYAKLQADCRALSLACPPQDVLQIDLDAIARREPDCVVKIVVTRGSGRRGYAIAPDAAPVRIVTSHPLPAYPDDYYRRGVRVRMCRMRLAAQPALAGVKHLNRLENVLARSEWSDPAVVEGIMCDSDDNVISGTMSNLFLVQGDALITPRLERCGVAGVQRALVLELARTQGVAAAEATVSIDQLLGADELFLVNSVIGVWQIATLDRRAWGTGKLTTVVKHWLEDARN